VQYCSYREESNDGQGQAANADLAAINSDGKITHGRPNQKAKQYISRESDTQAIPFFHAALALKLELMTGIEPVTSPLPRECSTN
jgi:hypothetical protein